MKKKTVLFLLALVFISCNKVDDQREYPESDSEKGIVLKERDPDYPWVPIENTKSHSQFSPRLLVTFDKCLGRAYKDDFFPVGTIENVTYSVVDIEKLSKDKPSYFLTKNLNEGIANSFAYSDFQRYTEKSSMSKKINGGFSLNLGLFSIGAKRKMSRIFTNSTLNEENRVFGELDVIYKRSQYVMQMSSRIRKEIILNYLSSDFKDELYGTTPTELFYNYGGFVLSDFITGGRASVVYTGLHKKNISEETNEKDMNTDINASYGFKMKNGSEVSGELGLGKSYSNGSTSSNELTSMMVSVKTIGGGAEFASFTPPKNINDLNVNLSNWLSTLNNEDKHSIVDISENGLIPLADFVMEENLKKGLLDCYKSEITAFPTLQEPYINIRLTYISGQIGVFQTSLITRFNDDVIIKSKYLYMGQANEYIQSEIARVSNIYGLKIVSDNTPFKYKISVYCDGLDETKMVKYIDSINNTIYLLCSEGKNKYGYSIHADKLLDDYAIRDFVNRLSPTNIDPLDLFNYTIIAL